MFWFSPLKRKSTRVASAGLSAFALLFLISACGHNFKAQTSNIIVDTENPTGFQAADGAKHTGAGADKVLPDLKAEIAGDADAKFESLSKADRELAQSVLNARLEGATDRVRVQVLIRDAGVVSFDFTHDMVAAKSKTDGPTDVRYKSVTGKLAGGDSTDFEAAMICRKHAVETGAAAIFGCKTATIALKSKRGAGAKAGLVIRHQDTLVLAKTSAAIKHETLVRLINTYKTDQPGKLQSFEVAWGASGFALYMGDTSVCPAGRLVETNELDEPLILNCPGVPKFHDIEGRMIGNTTKGEIFLELAATVPGILWGESTERIFILVRQKRTAKKPTVSTPAVPGAVPPAPGTPAAPTTPVTGPTAGTPPSTHNPPVAPPTQIVPEEEEMEDDGDPVFETPQPSITPPAALTGSSWMMPLDFNNKITQTWMKDRKHSVVNLRTAEWKKRTDLKNFASRFMVNRDIVIQGLAKERVPPEFSLIMLIESNFFKRDGYPIEGPKTTSAYGPWQMIDATAKNLGLRIIPRLVKRKFIAGNPCDERADLQKASVAAGKHIRKIIDMFPHDPKLVLLGYNQGEYGVEEDVQSLKKSKSSARLQAVREMGLSFWTIRKFNMAASGGIHYVENFLGSFHAALEIDPVRPAAIQPWRPNASCR